MAWKEEAFGMSIDHVEETKRMIGMNTYVAWALRHYVEMMHGKILAKK